MINVLKRTCSETFLYDKFKKKDSLFKNSDLEIVVYN